MVLELLFVTLSFQFTDEALYRNIHENGKICEYTVIVPVAEKVTDVEGKVVEPKVCQDALVSIGRIFPSIQEAIESAIRRAHSSDIGFMIWRDMQIEALAETVAVGRRVRIGSTTWFKYINQDSLYLNKTNQSSRGDTIRLPNGCQVNDASIRHIYDEEHEAHKKVKVEVRIFCRKRQQVRRFGDLFSFFTKHGIDLGVYARLDEYFGLEGGYDPLCYLCFSAVPETAEEYGNNVLFRTNW